ncbi:hypothetical protein HCA87_00455 [Listeria welshimeri]|nr:hypothetical protein [Listeria welshimeri]
MDDRQLIFDATIINCYTENDVVTIGIGDDEIAPNNYIIISRLDEDGVDTNDSIGFQTSESSREYSNAINLVKVKKHLIEVRITEDKVKEIGVSVIKISFNPNKVDMNLFFNYLRNIFIGSSVIINITDF